LVIFKVCKYGDEITKLGPMMKIKGEKKFKLFFIFWKVFHFRAFLGFALLGIF
jgi:hypothetical protein